jgi:hypothetical protein
MRNITPSTLGFGITTTWNGTSWNNGTPNVNMIARIAGTYTTATHGSISCLDLFLDSGTTTISSNTYIRVNRNITQAASGVTFNISSNGALALYDPNVDTTSVKVTISRTLPFNVARLDYRALGDPIGGKTAQSLSTGTLANRFLTYNPVSNGHVTNYFFNATTVGVDVASSRFIPGTGILIRTPNTFSLTPAPWTITTNNVSVTGKLNAGVIRVPFQKSNLPNTSTFILISNPYSAPIDMNKFMSANSFLTGGIFEWLRTNAATGGSYFISNKYSPNTTSTSTSTLGVIGVFQGFIVELPNTTTENSIVFTPDMMVVSEQFNLTDSFIINLRNPGIDLPDGRFCYTELRNPVNFKTNTNTLSSSSPLLNRVGTSSYTLYGDTTQRTSIDIDVFSTTTSTNISLLSTFGRFANASTTITLQDLTLSTTQNLKISSYTFSTIAGVTYSGRFKINIS